MESMHFAARLVIEQNMKHTTAFSARPDAPVLPVRAPRRLAISRAWRRAATPTMARPTAVLTPATGACN